MKQNSIHSNKILSLVFTLCSNNYLPFAKTLGDSILGFLPNARVIIGLVDRIDPELDYSAFLDFELLPCFDLGYPEFEDMLSRYNIIEFNTAVKPFYFEYLFRENPDVDRIFYIDPDIAFYQPAVDLDQLWDSEDSALLTPNLIFLSDQPSIGELASLRHGMNNLGFVGIRRNQEGQKLIEWWKERLRNHCRIDKCRGIFVDQKWMDLAPLFFSKIKSVKHPGWNMAWWNLCERKLFENEFGYFVNSDAYPLIFFHFSGFRPGMKNMTGRLKSTEFDLESEKILSRLFDEYEKRLLANGFAYWSIQKPQLKFREEPMQLKHRLGRKLRSKLNFLIYRIFSV